MDGQHNSEQLLANLERSCIYGAFISKAQLLTFMINNNEGSQQ